MRIYCFSVVSGTKGFLGKSTKIQLVRPQRTSIFEGKKVAR